MALARVVTFEQVDNDRIQKLQKDINEGERPQEIPATEIVVLYDREGQKSLVTLFFENEDDYKRADEFLSSMPSSDTPGRRTSVTKYDVIVRRSG